MKQLLYILILLVISYADTKAQNNIWSLKRCIDHAVEHNLNIQQNELDKRLAAIHLNSAKMNYYPTLNLSSNYGMNLGRSINPTTNQFETTQFSYTGLSANSNVLVFGWFQKKYNVQKNDLQLQQSKENYEQIKDDVSLNISTAYLRALLAQEQISNIEYQIDISLNNTKRIETLLNNGKSNVLELSQSKTQLATDSSLYWQAILNYEQSIIALKVILNLDFEAPFEIDTTQEVALFFLEKLDPETVYRQAEQINHNIRSSEYNIKIAEKDLKINKANSLPQLNLFYSAGTNYSSSYYELLPSGEKQLMNFGKQFNSNFSQSIGLGVNIPIFNNFSSRNNIQSASIQVQKAELNHQVNRQKLKEDIYTACTDYELSLQQYYNAQSVVIHAQTAYEAAQIRYEAGLINNFEYLTEKNNFLKAQNELSALKYDLWFKKLLIERLRNGN